MTNSNLLTLLIPAAMLVACNDDGLGGQSVVVVHGAWNGAWAWADVKADLEDRGANVTTVELPGHGEDMTPIPSITMRSYIDAVEAAIDASPSPVMLVGHSMGGMVVTEAADERASKIDRLVYVTAFVPKAGDSLLALSMTDATSELGPALAVDMTSGTIAVTEDKLTEVFCEDCDAQAAATLHTHYRDEPLAPFAEAAKLDDGGWARVPKFYIYADEDHAISPANQTAMTSGIQWRATANIDTGHSPFLSSPGPLSDLIESFATK